MPSKPAALAAETRSSKVHWSPSVQELMVMG